MAITPTEQLEVFANVVTTTMRDYDPILVPQIYANVVLLNHLRKTGKVKKISGGYQIAVGVVADKNPNFQWYSGSDVADMDEAAQFTRALYDWALARVAVKISDQDLDMNSGDKHRLHNLLMELVENARRTFSDELNVAVNGASTTPGELAGIGTFVTEAANQPLGGIDPTDPGNEYWDNNRITTGVYADTLKASLRTLYNQSITRVPAPQRDGIVFITDSEIFESYEDSLEEIARFMLTDARKESLGFGLADVLSFKGKPILWDDAAEADAVRLINTNFLRLIVHTKRDFSSDPARVFPDRHAIVSYIRFMGQLTCNFRDAQGGLFNVDVSQDAP